MVNVWGNLRKKDFHATVATSLIVLNCKKEHREAAVYILSGKDVSVSIQVPTGFPYLLVTGFPYLLVVHIARLCNVFWGATR